MGYWTSLNLNIIILMVSPYQNSKLKIQMLAGNSLNVCPDSDSQKKLPLGLSSTWLEYNFFPLRLYLQPFIECTEYSLEKVEGWKAILESGLGLLNYTPTPKLTQSNLIKPCCVLHRNPLLPSEWHRGIKISPTFRPYLRPLSTRIVSQSRVRLCTLAHL